MCFVLQVIIISVHVYLFMYLCNLQIILAPNSDSSHTRALQVFLSLGCEQCRPRCSTIAKYPMRLKTVWFKCPDFVYRGLWFHILLSKLDAESRRIAMLFLSIALQRSFRCWSILGYGHSSLDNTTYLFAIIWQDPIMVVEVVTPYNLQPTKQSENKTCINKIEITYLFLSSFCYLMLWLRAYIPLRALWDDAVLNI